MQSKDYRLWDAIEEEIIAAEEIGIVYRKLGILEAMSDEGIKHHHLKNLVKMEATGKYDIKGQAIYEDDILLDPVTKELIGIVEYSKEEAAYMVGEYRLAEVEGLVAGHKYLPINIVEEAAKTKNEEEEKAQEAIKALTKNIGLLVDYGLSVLQHQLDKSYTEATEAIRANKEELKKETFKELIEDKYKIDLEAADLEIIENYGDFYYVIKVKGQTYRIYNDEVMKCAITSNSRG